MQINSLSLTNYRVDARCLLHDSRQVHLNSKIFINLFIGLRATVKVRTSIVITWSYIEEFGGLGDIEESKGEDIQWSGGGLLQYRKEG